jgi:hypothetical protein
MKLLIFSRRALQQRLDALSAQLSSKAFDDLLGRLNQPGTGRLPAMWEAVWLHALGQVGPFEQERPLATGKSPDFSFSLPIAGGVVDVVGDITCVSDRGLHDTNPIQQFWNELVRLARVAKLNPNHFKYQVGHRTEGEFPKTRTVLKLPSRGQLPAFLKQHVVPFLRALARSGDATGKLKIRVDDADVTISYDMRQQFGGGGHAAYTSFTSPIRNPIYTQLSKKEKQLRGAPQNALRAVFLCDAGCQAMQRSQLSTSMSADEIVGQFLRKSSAIDLVLIVSAERLNPLDQHYRRHQLRARIAGAPAQPGTRRTVEAGAALRQYLDRALAYLPVPVLDPHNASLRASHPAPGTGTLGIRMNYKSVRLSARVVLDLLAGRISAEEFQRIYGWHPESERFEPNPFARALERGQLLTTASVSPGGDEDDDWLEFGFGDVDPATAAFRRPTA